jgi:uncharacterized protein
LPKSLLVYSAAADAASHSTMIPAKTAGLSPGLVLDTNATLDWMVFGNPAMTPLRLAIEAGAVRWLACPRMRDELLRTLAYPALARFNPDRERTLTCFDRWVQMQLEPRHLPAGQPVCSDPDDQVFIDLALEHQARWLVTHDRALLKLRRQAAQRGVAVLPPAQWPGPAGMGT